jgi:hypothetical protein
MPSRSDAAFLREKAAKYRKLAARCETTVAAKMLEVAIELEVRAAEYKGAEPAASLLSSP